MPRPPVSHVQRKPASTLEERVFVEIKRTGEQLALAFTEMFRDFKLTAPQYNVLRILRGGPTEGLSCSEIVVRMLHRDSDMTRLLDSLEKRKLVKRRRSVEDRRIVMATISASGRELLEELDKPFRKLHRQQLGHMTKRDQQELVRLLELARVAAQ